MRPQLMTKQKRMLCACVCVRVCVCVCVCVTLQEVAESNGGSADLTRVTYLVDTRYEGSAPEHTKGRPPPPQSTHILSAHRRAS